MANDLSDAKASVDWANAQLPALQIKIRNWVYSDTRKPYTIRIDANSEPGKKLFYLSPVEPVPALIVVEAGIVLHCIRSSLDIWACTLATRAGHPDREDVYFPICENAVGFFGVPAHDGRKKQRGGREKIKWLSAADQAVIETMQPYYAGYERLWSLHKLDSTRKHRRLLKPGFFSRGIGMSGFRGHKVHFGHAEVSGEQETLLAWTDASAPDGDFNLGLHITFREGHSVDGEQVTRTLAQFASLAEAVIQVFD
jgi:hypothetical protein